MSRKSVSNDKYTMAFGVDHTPMGAFFQIWELAAEGENEEMDGMEAPQIDCDELFGLRVHPPTLNRNRPLKEALRVFEQSPKAAVRTESAVCEVAWSLGFNINKDVYELWD